jgi:hypothetical protein
MNNKFIGFIAVHRRLVLTITVFMLAAGVFFFNSDKKENSVSASTYNVKYYTCIDIQDNDTLWGIADEYITEEYKDRDAYIKEVKFINDLTDDKLYSGATLIIPYYAAPK